MMAAAEIRGMEKAGVSGTLKHFAANNQETARVDCEARMNEEHMPLSVRNTSAMIRAQNDLYMIVDDSKKNPKKDNTLEALEDGRLSREELLRSAANICNVLMHISHEMR